MTNAAVVFLSVGAAYFALGFHSLMDYIQLILSTFNAPLFALVVLAVIAPRKAAGGGRTGFLLGLGCCVVHQVLVLTHVLHYGSQMAANFYGAVFGFLIALAGTLWIGSLNPRNAHSFTLEESRTGRSNMIAWPSLTMGLCLAALLVIFNVIFW